MTQAVAKSIRGLVGNVRKVDKSGSRDCIGRFLHVKIRFNVRGPLMRGTFVIFPDEGKLWVDFKYKALPKYCLICGMLGHATRVCKEIQEERRLEDGRSREMEESYAFKGLDADTDLRGNPLGSGGRGKTSGSSTGGRKSPERYKDARNKEYDGGRRSSRSSTAFGMGSHTQLGDNRSQSGSERSAKIDDKEIDTAISPSKPRWSMNKNGTEGSKLAERIRKQQEKEEAARLAR